LKLASVTAAAQPCTALGIVFSSGAAYAARAAVHELAKLARIAVLALR